MSESIAALILAAGAGRRYGGAKVLADEGDGPWGPRTAAVLAAAGCDPVVVVLGAEESAARSAFAGGTAQLVSNPDWESGMASSLRVGLTSLARQPPHVHAAVLMLVDLPDMTAEAVTRVMTVARQGELADAVLQATFDGVAGHPVLLGRAHWAGAADSAAGDSGARRYLAAHPPQWVEVGDLAGGVDRDTPPRAPENQ